MPVGLFVEDGSLAIAILMLVGALDVISSTSLFLPIVIGLALLVGPDLILLENFTRTANRVRRR